MAIQDAYLHHGSATVSSAAVNLPYVIDCGAGDIAQGKPMSVAFNLDQTGTAGTIKFSILSSANADLSSPTVIASTGDVDVAGKLGVVAVLGLPPTLNGMAKRYLGVQATPTGLTSVSVSAFMLETNQAVHLYPIASAIK